MRITIPPETRFWAKVNKTDTCWLWEGAKRGKNSPYGVFQLKKHINLCAHRFAYELVRGKIPDGLTIDHLCRTPLCVNPDHLEAVTLKVNLQRAENQLSTINSKKTHCPKGHPYSQANTMMANGSRVCRACRAAYGYIWRSRQHASI